MEHLIPDRTSASAYRILFEIYKGRRAPRRIINRALTQPISASNVARLLSLGYLADASGHHLELAHDLLREALRESPEAQKVASRLALSIRGKEGYVLTEEQRAAIYYAAGPRYYSDSWKTTRHIIEKRSRRQEYLSLPPLFERLERIASASRAIAFDSNLAWLAAITEQHCGNTYAALQRFLKIKEAAVENLPKNAERYINAMIEIGNQHILRAEPTPAIRSFTDVVDMLSDPALRLPRKVHARLAALAHNRHGAILHLVDRRDEALEHFNIALSASSNAGDDYLRSHTHWNLAALFRFTDPVGALRHLQMARCIWNEKLRHKERFRLMIECSESYSASLIQNSSLTRARLRTVAAEASEKGYLFQACSTLLCLSSCLLASEQWQDAKYTLLRALDLTAITEDLKNRTFVSHYLSVCAHLLGDELECRDWCCQAMRVLVDNAYAATELSTCLRYNESVTAGNSPEDARSRSKKAGMLLWYPYDRA